LHRFREANPGIRGQTNKNSRTNRRFVINKLLFLAFFIFTGSFTWAQFYDFGQDPGSLKWNRLDTEHFRIIYPRDFSDNAQNLARLMENSYRLNSAQLNHKPGKVPLIIHNQTVVSNAFVTWAPKRMELFTFPDPDLYPIDWLNELSLHEYRHVIHIDKLNQGFTRFLTLFLGQQINGVVAGVMPLWFIEGDAVTAETSLSNSGRGRLPSFEMELKANLLSKPVPYSLSKAYLGSFKDNVPDYYRLGYQIVNYTKQRYGEDYWSNALDYIGKRPFLISPFHFYTKKVTGSGQNILYKNAMNNLKQHWEESLDARNPETLTPLNSRPKKLYTSYNQARISTDSSVFALKTSLNSVPRFVRINSDGREEHVFTPGSLVSERFSLSNNKIIWDEYVQDIRWRNRSYSVLREFNIETGESHNLTRKTRYISPSFSADGKSIVAVNTGTDYKFSLVILNSADGQILLNIPSPDNSYLHYPEWVNGSEKIAVISNGKDGKAILVYDLKTKTWNEIFKSGYVNIDQLRYSGNHLFFTGGFDGTDQIYSVNLTDRKIRKHSNSPFGAFQPDVSSDNQRLVYSSYGMKGYDIVQKSINTALEEEYILPDTIKEQSFYSVSMNAGSTNKSVDKVETIDYEVKPYSKAARLFSFHSWAPYWFDYTDPNIDDPQISPGITLLSQNDLSTAITSLGYERNNGTNYFHSRFTYKGLFPVIDFSARYGGLPQVAEEEGFDPPELSTDLSYALSVYLPMNLSSGKIITGMQPSLQVTYNSTYFYHFSENKYIRGMEFVEPRIYFYSYLRTSARDIQPRLGFTFDTKFTSTPFENELYGNNKSLRLSAYLPGLIKNQGLKLRAEWQNQDVYSYFLPNHFALPRGYLYRPFIQMSRYSADYAFPVLYPDISLGSFFYLKRIRGNFYVDYMKGTERYVRINNGGYVKTKPEYPLSQGLELFADYHLFRFIIEFNSGLRLNYLPREKSIGVQMLFSINLDKF